METKSKDEIKFFEGNREEWLNKVADFIYDKIEEEFVREVDRDKIKLSIGFMPKGNAKLSAFVITKKYQRAITEKSLYAQLVQVLR